MSQEEGIAIPVALLGHVLMVAALVFLKPADLPPPLPERMEVTISSDVGLTSTSPDPKADPAPDKGPELGDMPPPPVPDPVAVAKPEPRPIVTPPKPAPAPRPQVQARAVPKPQTKPSPPQAKPAARPQAQSQRSAVAPRPGTRPGASRFDDAFGAGIPGGKPAGKSATAPAAATGQQKSSWTSSINNKVLRPWNACPVSGLDVEKLRARVHFTLDIGGRVASIDPPQVTGITAANRAQVKPFSDCAVRAIRLAAPFTGLSADYFSDWKDRTLNFRKK
ncbi:MAG: hypothetical protein ABL914_12120 [Novosphingobium sp.]